MKAKKTKQNPYQNNEGGMICAPFAPKKQPAARREVGKGDLRTKKNQK